MDHNGLYTDLDNFAGITGTSSTTTNTNFNNDTCPSLLPSLNNFKYQQTSTNLLYSNNIPSVDHHSSKSSSSTTTLLPPTQININNCNNNFFLPLGDDGIFSEPSQQILGTDRSGTCPVATTNTNNAGSGQNQQKNNFIGYLRKETGSSGGGGDNITYNINNINTNIVNNVVNNSDVFTGNQYHQISKPALGETIINFTNNNLNSTANSSMPVDTASVTSQNYYGFQSTNNNSNNVQGQQQSSFETTHHQQQQQSSTTQQHQNSSAAYHDVNFTNMGLFHGNHLYQGQSSMSQKTGTFTNASQQDFSSTSSIPVEQYHQEHLPAAAKIINSFETKNPLKYPNNRSSGNYYGKTSEYPPQYSHLTSHPSHAYSNVYPNAKIPPTHNYTENYPPQPPRNAYPPQHFTDERSPILNRHHNYPPQSHHSQIGPITGPSNANGYGIYGNGYNPITQHSHYPSPYPSQLPPSSPYCSKPSPASFQKSTSMGVTPVDHSNFPLQHARSFSASKKEFFQEQPTYYPPHHQMPHANFYENPKKISSHRPKVIAPPPEMYNKPAYNEHHLMPPTHPSHPNNVRYQQMPKPPSFNGAANYPIPPSIPAPQQNSLDYGYPHNFQFPPYMNGKNGEHHKMPKMTSLQYHYDSMPSTPHHIQPTYRYHTMQAKPPEKIKSTNDLEEQINSSKIAKLHHNPAAYGFHGEYPGHYYQQLHPYHPNYSHSQHPQHSMMPSRNHMMSDEMKSATVGSNINISLRDFLQTWNEIDDEDDGTRHVVDDERTIRREYNPMFIQKSAEHFPHIIPTEKTSNVINEHQLSNDGSEKLYVLESIDVPLSELNKYKHLSVINKLPENVVIDKELYGDVDGSMKFIEDLTRGEKLYKSEFELEFEACQEEKIIKPPTIDESIPLIMSSDIINNKKLQQKSEKVEENVNNEVIEKVVEVFEVKDENETLKCKKEKEKVLKVKVPKEKSPKILKLKKEKIMKDPRKFRITKRMKKYSLTSRTSSSAVRSLKSICIDFVNTSQYRNFARHQLSIINKHSKMRVLKDFKKKFNFNNGGCGIRKPLINQKFNHSSGRINSLTEICGKMLVNKQDDDTDDYEDDDEVFEEENSNIHEVSSLKNICKQFLIDMNFDVVENDDANYLYTPSSLRELCENFIYNNRQYFHIEEVNNVPKLQEICKEVLNNENIYVNFDQQQQQQQQQTIEPTTTVENEEEEEPIYIVEENSENVGELFESENLNSFEKTEILRRIQSVANIEDDDEIMRAIGALHDVDPIIDNNNECDVSNKNIQGSDEDFSMLNGDEMKFDSEMTFVSYLNDDLLHSVQYEEILNGNGQCTSNNNKHLKEILQFKYLNRAYRQQKRKIISRIVKKSKKFKRKMPKRKRRRICDKKVLSHKNKLNNESLKCDDDAKDSRNIIKKSKSINIKNDISSEAESNLPKLPSVLPSINEYKIEKNSNHRNNNIKDSMKKPRKLSFEESLLNIDKMMMSFEDEDSSKSRRRSSTSSSNSSHHRNHHNNHHHQRHRSSSHRSSQSRSHGSRRSRSKSKQPQQHHKSSRENCYKKDQIKHSEAKRLVIPSYKLYDKNLDIKLKTKPYVKIEREEKVDEMMMRKLI
jgi:hypothetical protein